MSRKEVESICKKFGIRNWTLNDDGSIDVDGEVNFSYAGLDKIPLSFRSISDGLYCRGNNLTTLEGFPDRVGELVLSNNRLTSLEGCTSYIDGDFDCSGNNLTSLLGGPTNIVGDLWCIGNKLTDFEGFLKQIGYGVYLKDSPVEVIWKIFQTESDIEFFNDCNPIRGDIIILNRFNFFLEEIGRVPADDLLIYNLKSVGYKIII